MLSNISFLHQTTTVNAKIKHLRSCQISLFYIKPQQTCYPHFDFIVVKYLFSTSNHNGLVFEIIGRCVVKYLFSTSNHNSHAHSFGASAVVKYLFSTSNHNIELASLFLSSLSNISFLHQTTTLQAAGAHRSQLSNISFLHQTTTKWRLRLPLYSCQISLFYIKPQPAPLSFPE